MSRRRWCLRLFVRGAPDLMKLRKRIHRGDRTRVVFAEFVSQHLRPFNQIGLRVFASHQRD